MKTSEITAKPVKLLLDSQKAVIVKCTRKKVLVKAHLPGKYNLL